MKPTIVFFGTPELAATILDQLIQADRYQLKTVITQADKPVGRKQILTASPVAVLAQQNRISTLKPSKLTAEFINEHQAELSADLFVVAAYGKIIPQSLLDLAKLGAINVHPSLLPKYRGPSPIQSAILNGDEITGITIMLMDAEMDHGPILNTTQFKLSDQYNTESLSKELALAGSALLADTIDQFLAKTITPQPQNHSQATYVKLVKKSDGYFDIEAPPPADQLDRMIRAYYPWPNVWTRWSPNAKTTGDNKQKIVKFYPGKKIQMEGKNIISWVEFKRGYPEFPLDLN